MSDSNFPDLSMPEPLTDEATAQDITEYYSRKLEVETKANQFVCEDIINKLMTGVPNTLRHFTAVIERQAKELSIWHELEYWATSPANTLGPEKFQEFMDRIQVLRQKTSDELKAIIEAQKVRTSGGQPN